MDWKGSEWNQMQKKKKMHTIYLLKAKIRKKFRTGGRWTGLVGSPEAKVFCFFSGHSSATAEVIQMSSTSFSMIKGGSEIADGGCHAKKKFVHLKIFVTLFDLLDTQSMFAIPVCNIT